MFDTGFFAGGRGGGGGGGGLVSDRILGQVIGICILWLIQILLVILIILIGATMHPSQNIYTNVIMICNKLSIWGEENFT